MIFSHIILQYENEKMDYERWTIQRINRMDATPFTSNRITTMKKSIHLPDTVTVLIQGKNLKPGCKMKYYKRNIPIAYAGQIISFIWEVTK